MIRASGRSHGTAREKLSRSESAVGMHVSEVWTMGELLAEIMRPAPGIFIDTVARRFLFHWDGTPAVLARAPTPADIQGAKLLHVMGCSLLQSARRAAAVGALNARAFGPMEGKITPATVAALLGQPGLSRSCGGPS